MGLSNKILFYFSTIFRFWFIGKIDIGLHSSLNVLPNIFLSESYAFMATEYVKQLSVLFVIKTCRLE